MPDYQTLLFDVAAGVATITLNRPDAANALTLEMARDLADAALRCDEDPAIRAVLITGAGRFFCAGGDLRSFSAQGEGMPAHMKDLLGHLHAAIARFARMDPPVIAAVNGVAAGAGMSLACLTDLALAGEGARFTMAYTRAGLSPDGSGTFHLPRLVGLRRALELTLTNRMLSAREALDIGLLNEVVPDGELAERAKALAAGLAAGPTGAFGEAKRLLRAGWNETLETQMETEGRVLAARARSTDGREGIAAFLEKREPRFAGS
jgi:2-(1,2-epoxy-1,2-dihydrophenyl)acetyl-CoA isomerase